MSDPNYNSVSLLLHFDGANGSTTFTDNSPSPKTVTANFDAQISTTQSKFGGASGYFDGTGDYLSIPDNSDFDFGSGDFTIEGWVNAANFSARRPIYSQRSSSSSVSALSWSIDVNGYLNFTYFTSAGLSDSLSASLLSAIAINTWVFVAVSRSGTSLKQFVNGNTTGSHTLPIGTIIRNSSVDINVGRDSANSSWLFNGYIDDLRVTKGVARYTANFTPPTAAFPDFDKPRIRVSDPGPLGAENLLGYVKPRAIASDPGPLGAELMLAQQWAALVSAPSMLGEPNLLAWNLFARADVPTMLGNADLLAWHLFARADVPSMLGEPSPLATHDFTEVIGDATTYYVMDLTTPSGLVRVPISSWQATLQSGLSNYVQCVVPAVSAYVSAINAATQFKISRLVDVPGLAAPLTYEMATAPVQTTTFDQGPFRYTCTISGYSSGFAPNETPSAAYNRIMQGIRSISINQGGTRVRCSIDWLLRPSQRVFASSEEFVVSYINYYVGEGDAYMEVGERA
jgi:hypothetical protein